MFKSIFGRLFWTNVMILLLVFVSVSVSVSIFVGRYAVNKQVEKVDAVSDTIEYWTGALQIENSNTYARLAYKQTIASWADFVNADIIIFNKSGKLSASTSSVRTVPEDFFNTVISGNKLIKKSNFGGEYDKRVLTVGMPVHYQDTIVGAMFFNMRLPDINYTAMELILLFLIASTFSILVAFVLVYIESKRISRPIGMINRAARDIAAGNFSERVTVDSKDEIGQLASSFNFMADSIEHIEERSQRFVSDISHELRTPMTSISGFVQGMLDGTIPEDKRDYYLQIVLDESVRLTKLTNDMLEMSKLSSSTYKLDITEFDLNELIRRCIIELESKINERNLDLKVDFEKDELRVLADKDCIHRVIINLLDNAVKFSYPNTTIDLRAYVSDGKAAVSIGNFGDGISGADLSNVFTRFYKTDKSRTSEKSGAGLGLSFVKNILALHKQSVWVESMDAKEGSDVKYTKFTFTLELA